MFWCIPLPFSFRHSNKGTKSVSSSARMKPISAPVGLDEHSRRMQFPIHNSDATANDTRPFYLVPNKHGPGKSIIRCTPIPPPRVPPHDEDYDNVTQAATTMAQKGDTDWPVRTRGSQMTGGSSMPAEDNSDAATYTVPGGDSKVDLAWNPHSPRTRDKFPPRARTTPSPKPERYFPARANTNTASPASGSRTAHEPAENYGDYNIYMQGIERMITQEEVEERKMPDVESPERKALGRMRSREVVKNPITRTTIPGRSSPYRFDGALHHNAVIGNRNRRRGARPGQEYEIVNRRVVEDTPERTVTIDEWRQKVARETSPNDVETMSIRYMGLEDYAAAEQTTTEVDSNVQSAHRTPLETGRSDSIRSIQPVDEPSKEVQPAIDSEGRISPIDPEIPSPPTPPQKSSSNIPQARSVSSHSRNHSTPPRIATPDRLPVPKTLSRSSRGATRRTIPAFQEPPPLPEPSRAPSPPHASPARAFTFNILPASPVNGAPGSFSLPQSPLQESTPIRSNMSPIPFHPTQSQGSTISSIQSESYHRFEELLGSCKPSLLRIAPILARLGITKVEHLKAVSRLSEEMRDREVREEALRMGITVVEWAVLLDQVRML